MANSNIASANPNTSPAGSYIQPSTGIVVPVHSPADVSGNLYTTSLAASGLANLQTAAYRDSIITVNNGSTSTHPSAGGTIVAITPGTAGLWEVAAQVAVSGTTVAAADSNNFALNVGTVPSIAAITYPVQSTTGSSTVNSTPGVVLNLGTASVVNVTAVATSTAGSIYSATLVARRVG